MKLTAQADPGFESRCLCRVLTLVTVTVPRGDSSTQTGHSAFGANASSLKCAPGQVSLHKTYCNLLSTTQCNSLGIALHLRDWESYLSYYNILHIWKAEWVVEQINERTYIHSVQTFPFEFIFSYVHQYVRERLCTWGQCLGRSEEGTSSPGAGITGSCQPPSMDAESPTQILWKSKQCADLITKPSLQPHFWDLHYHVDDIMTESVTKIH